MKYFEFLEPPFSSSIDEIRTHPHPKQRQEVINKQLSPLTPGTERYVKHFHLMIDYGKKVLD